MSFSTLRATSKTLNLNEDALADLSELTLIVEDFGEDPDSEFAGLLIEMGRKILVQEDCTIRVGKVDAKPFEARIYILSDLIIVGKYKKSKKKGKKSKQTMMTMQGGTQDKIVFGAPEFLTHDGLENMSDGGESKSSKREGMNLKLKLWVDLSGSGVQVRDLHKADNHGIRIIYTTKETVEDDNGEVEFVTNVDQTEVFFESEDSMGTFSKHIHDAIDTLLERQLGDIDDLSVNDSMTIAGTMKQSMTSLAMTGGVEAVDDEETNADDEVRTQRSGSTRSAGKARAHTRAKATMKKIQRHRNNGKSLGGTDAAPLTLDDIKKKYQVSNGPKAQADLAEFSVSFKQGAMGFALSSSGKDDAHGVFVGKLEENGMADVSGVTLGDRVVEIGGVKVEDSMSWQDCIGIIKTKRGELSPDGKPKPLIVKFARERSFDENIAKANEKKKEDDLKNRVKEARAKRKGMRQWKTKKNKLKTFENRMASLHDLEQKYRNQGEGEKRQESVNNVFEKIKELCETPEEKKCAYILEEIHTTEKNYVHDLYMLSDNYLKKLINKQVYISCHEKAAIGATKFCEHKVAAKSCDQMSSTKKKLLSPEDRKVLFMNIEVITKLNEELLRSLQKGLLKLNDRLAAGDKTVGVNDIVEIYSPAFIRLMPFYAMYSQYASKYAKAIDRLSYLQANNPEFATELEQLEKKKDVKGFKNLLIVPVMRLTKYPLLFQTLTKAMRPYLEILTKKIIATNSGDIDKLIKLVEDLEKTNQTVEKIASTVDFKVDEHSKIEVLNEIFHELGGVKYIKEFFKPSRRFIHRFEDVTYEDQSKAKAKKERVVFVFNDMIIIGAYKKGSKKTLKAPQSPQKPGRNSKNTLVNGGKSTLSKSDSKSLLGRSTTKGGGFFNKMMGRSSGPAIKIEYMSEMKHIKLVKARENAEGWFGAQIFMRSAPPRPDDDADKTKKRKQSLVDTKPVVVKLDLYLEKAVQRDLLFEQVQEQQEMLRQKEESVKDAKVTMGQARMRLRDKRRLKMKESMGAGADPASSASRQETLREKLMAHRARKKTSGA